MAKSRARKATRKRPKRAPKPKDRFTAAPFNPRAITPAASRGLETSMSAFGDLAVITLNKTTHHIVTGHQRTGVLPDFDKLHRLVKWSPPEIVTYGHPGARFKAAEQFGTIKTPARTRFTLRLVEWPLAFEKQANVAANNPALQGTFTEDLQDLLVEMQADLAPEAPTAFGDLLMGDLLADVVVPKIRELAVKPPPPMTWVLLGIPTVRFGKISPTIEELAARKDLICEITTSDAGADLVPSPAPTTGKDPHADAPPHG